MIKKELTSKQIINRQKWTAALRSGDYSQGRGSLRILDNYCCLGVCVACLDGWQLEPNHVVSFMAHGRPFHPEPHKVYSSKADNLLYNTAGCLPKKYLERLGLTHEEQRLLMHANDELHLNFHQIADIIESQEEITSKVMEKEWDAQKLRWKNELNEL